MTSWARETFAVGIKSQSWNKHWMGLQTNESKNANVNAANGAKKRQQEPHAWNVAVCSMRKSAHQPNLNDSVERLISTNLFENSIYLVVFEKCSRAIIALRFSTACWTRRVIIRVLKHSHTNTIGWCATTAQASIKYSIAYVRFSTWLCA